MRVDPQVNRRKFDSELGRLIERRWVLEQRGMFVLGSTNFPHVDILVVPSFILLASPTGFEPVLPP